MTIGIKQRSFGTWHRNVWQMGTDLLGKPTTLLVVFEPIAWAVIL